MALDYILNNTGQEVQERLDQVPVTQVQLTDEIANREAADSALRDSIGAETTRAEGAEQALDGRITSVEGKVPQDATPQNPLADKDWVADSIATATADFITACVNDLVNYYLKSETYTKAEVQHIVDAVKQFNYQSVPELPVASASTKGIIYLVPSADPQSENVKDEYITVYHTNEMGVTYYEWEQIGSTAIDLADYYTKSQTDAAITADLNTALASYSTTAQMNTAIETAIANLDLSDTYETKGAAAAVVGDAGEDYNTLAKIEEKLLPVEEASGDKVYEAGSGKGLGRKNLPLNSIGNKNLLSQSMINQANTVYVVQNDYEIGSDGSVNLNEDPISVTIGGVNYYCKEVSLNAGETILLTTTGSAKIIVNDGGSWTLYSYNYYTAQSNTTIRLGAVPTSQTSTINYIKTGGSITIPANCTLKFEGGSISGGTINFNRAYIDAPCVPIFKDVVVPKNETGIPATRQEVTYFDWFENSNGAHYAYIYALQVAGKLVCTPGKEYTFKKCFTSFQSVKHDVEIAGNNAIFRFTSTYAVNADWPDVLYHHGNMYMHDLTVYYHVPQRKKADNKWIYSRFCSGWKENPNTSAHLENIYCYVEPETPTENFKSAFNTLYETYCGNDFILRNCHLTFAQPCSDNTVSGNSFAWFMFMECPDKINVLVEDCSCVIGCRDEALALSRSAVQDHEVELNVTVKNSKFSSVSTDNNDAPLITLGDNAKNFEGNYDFTINANIDGCTFYRNIGDPEYLRTINSPSLHINLNVTNCTFTYEGDSPFEYISGSDTFGQGVLNLAANANAHDYSNVFTNCTFNTKYVFDNVSGIAPVTFNNCTFNIASFTKFVIHTELYPGFSVPGTRDFVGCQINLSRDRAGGDTVLDGTVYLDNPEARFINCDIKTTDGSMFGLYRVGNGAKLEMSGNTLNGYSLPDIEPYHVVCSPSYSYKWCPIVPPSYVSFRWNNDLGEPATVTFTKLDGTEKTITVAAGQSTPSGTEDSSWWRIMEVTEGDVITINIKTDSKRIVRRIYCGTVEGYNRKKTSLIESRKSSGTFADKPTTDSLPYGFEYFCTDLGHSIFLKQKYSGSQQYVACTTSQTYNAIANGLDIQRYCFRFAARENVKLYASTTDTFTEQNPAPGTGAIFIAENNIISGQSVEHQVQDEIFVDNTIDRTEYPYLCLIKSTTVAYGSCTIHQAGLTWVDADGAIAGVARKGTTAQRPAGNSIYVGFEYFDTDLGKIIYASAIASSSPYTVTWVDADGVSADVKKAGEITERPSTVGLKDGFTYLVTDQWTPTGGAAQDPGPIYYVDLTSAGGHPSWITVNGDTFEDMALPQRE